MERNTQARIRMLLDLYFESATTLEQEKELRDYFAGDRQVPEELRYAQAMFGFFRDASQEVSVSEISFGRQDGAHGREITLAPQKPVGKIAGRRRRILMIVASSAAAIAALLTFTLVDYHGSRQLPDEKVVYCYVNGVPVTDIETAMLYTQLSLDTVGETMRIPADYLATIEEPVSLLNKTMESLSDTGNLINNNSGAAAEK